LNLFHPNFICLKYPIHYNRGINHIIRNIIYQTIQRLNILTWTLKIKLILNLRQKKQFYSWSIALLRKSPKVRLIFEMLSIRSKIKRKGSKSSSNKSKSKATVSISKEIVSVLKEYLCKGIDRLNKSFKAIWKNILKKYHPETITLRAL
jgi:hypothetical protein